MPYAWWIAETDLDASAGIDTAVTWTDESAVATISLGPATAPGDGLAVAFVAVDTLSNWLSGGRAATWTDSFAEVAAPTTPSNDCCMSIATVAVRDGASVSTRATSASGGRDQASGVLLVIGEASEASGSTEIETIGEITAAGTKHATGTTDIAAVAELTATGVKHAVGTVTIEVVAEVTASGEPGTTEPVLAARVVSQPVDDQLVVTITHSSGRKSRWGGDEPDASGIPQGISTKTSAPGGFQDASMSLVRDPRLDWPDMRLVDHVEIAGNTRPLGRAAFEGQMDAFPAQLADAFSIGAEVIGYQCMLEDDESWSQVYIDRELSRFQGPRAQRQLDLIDSNRPHQGDATASWDTDSSVPALVLAVNGSWASPAIPRCEAWYDAGAGNVVTGIRSEWSSSADTAWILRGAFYKPGAGFVDFSDVYTTRTGVLDEDTTSTDRRYAVLIWEFNATSAGADGTTFAVKLFNLRVHGDHGLTLRADANGAAGYYGHDVIAHMISTGAPGLNYRVGYDGTIIPETAWVLQQLAFHDQGRVAEALNTVNAHYLRNWAVWENREFHWHRWSPDQRVVWRVRVAGGAHWSPAGPDAESLVNGVVVSHRDESGATRTAGPPGSGCDTESALLQDTRQENPYNAWGRRRWAKLDLPFPTTGRATGGAVQIGYVWLQDQMRPQRSGTLVLRPLGDGHVPQIEHPTAGPVPVWACRAGDYVDLVDYPEAEPFRVIATDYQHDTRTLTCTLDNTPRLASALLERVGVRTGTLGI